MVPVHIEPPASHLPPHPPALAPAHLTCSPLARTSTLGDDEAAGREPRSPPPSPPAASPSAAAQKKSKRCRPATMDETNTPATMDETNTPSVQSRIVKLGRLHAAARREDGRAYDKVRAEYHEDLARLQEECGKAIRERDAATAMQARTQCSLDKSDADLVATRGKCAERKEQLERQKDQLALQVTASEERTARAVEAVTNDLLMQATRPPRSHIPPLGDPRSVHTPHPYPNPHPLTLTNPGVGGREGGRPRGPTSHLGGRRRAACRGQSLPSCRGTSSAGQRGTGGGCAAAGCVDGGAAGSAA